MFRHCTTSLYTDRSCAFETEMSNSQEFCWFVQRFLIEKESSEQPLPRLLRKPILPELSSHSTWVILRPYNFFTRATSIFFEADKKMMSLCVFVLILLAALLLVLKKDKMVQQPDKYEEAYRLGIRALRNHESGIVVFDFDDCLINTDKILLQSGQHGPLHEPIWPIVRLAQFAHAKGLHVMVLTARTDSERARKTVLEHVQRMNLKIDDLRLRLDHEPPRFKIKVRQRLENVLLTIGDQWPDVDEATSAWIKLPSRGDASLYYGNI